MPSAAKRLLEGFKQRVPVFNTKDWRPTSNERNNKMVDEARCFAKHLKLLMHDLGSLQARVEAALATMRTVLSARLPRAYDETGQGVAPVDPEDHIVGVSVNHDAITSAALEMKQRLTDEVLFPLQQWLAAYRSIKVSNKKVEEVRLDLDTKRRETLNLQEEHAKLQGKNHKNADTVLYKAQSEEDKMNRLATRYHEMEAEVFNALLTLISDTAVLRDYQAAALAIVQRCFTMAYTAFDLSATVSMPVLPNYQQMPDPSAQNLEGGYQPQAAGMAIPGQPTAPGNMFPASPNVSGSGYHQPANAVPLSNGPPLPAYPMETKPAVPAWYTEAKANAKQGGRASDSGDEQPYYKHSHGPSAPPM